MDTLSTLRRDLAEMRSQLADCFPDQQDWIEQAEPKVIVWGIARHFGTWDAGDFVVSARDLYALAPLMDAPTTIGDRPPAVGGDHGYPAEGTVHIDTWDGSVFAWEAGGMGSGTPGHWQGKALGPRYR